MQQLAVCGFTKMSDTYFPSSQCTDGRFTGKGVVAFSLRSYQNSPTASF